MSKTTPIISFLLCLAFTSLSAQESSFTAYYEDGKRAIAQEDYKEAIEFFKAAQISTDSDALKDTISNWIDKANDDWRQSLELAKNRAVKAQGEAELAQEEAEKQATISEANRLASLADIENERIVANNKDNYVNALYLSNLAIRKGQSVQTDILLAKRAFGNAIYHLYTQKLGQHTDKITLSIKNSHTALTCGRDKIVQIWNEDGQLVRKLTDHTNSILGVSYASNGQYILTCSADKTAKIWNSQGRLHKTLAHHTGEVLGGIFSKDSQKILTWSRDSTAKLWTIEGVLLATLKHQGSVYDAQFSASGLQLLTRSSDQTVRLWDTNGQLRSIINDDQGYIYHATFSPQDNQLLTCSANKTIKIWDFQGKAIITIPQKDIVKYATYSSNGSKILSINKSNQVQIWSLEGKLIKNLSHQNRIHAAYFSDDGNQVITASEDATAKIWNLENGSVITLEHLAGVKQVQWNETEQLVLTLSLIHISEPTRPY